MSVAQQCRALELERVALLDDLLLPLDTTNLDWKPDSASWSALEVMEHLVLVDELVVEQVPEAAQIEGRLRGRLIVQLMRLASVAGARVQVPVEAITPLGQATIDELLERWRQARFRLFALTRKHEARATSAVLLTHPVAGALSFPDGLNFLVTHQRHHRRQLERLAAARRLAGIPASARRGDTDARRPDTVPY